MRSPVKYAPIILLIIISLSGCDLVSGFFNEAPTADAGPDKSVVVGDTVILDGTGSTDANGDPLSFTWSFVEVPPTSGLTNSDIQNRNSGEASFTPDTDGEFRVRVSVSDGQDQAEDFVVITVSPLQPPTSPINLSPADAAANVSVTPTLTWDVVSNADSYTLYLGQTDPPSEYQTGITDSSLSISTALAHDTQYFWQVEAVNGDGVAESTVISFTTVVDVPPAASSPTPGDGAADLNLPLTLDWADVPEADSYTVYFGADSLPTTATASGLTASQYDPGTLANSTTYVWRVDTVNAGGTTTGASWSFTTVDTGDGPITPDPQDPADPSVTISGLSADVPQGEVLTLSSSGFDSYTWYLNGDSSHSALSSSSGESITLDTSGLYLGSHQVTLFVTSGSDTYSTQASFTVGEAVATLIDWPDTYGAGDTVGGYHFYIADYPGSSLNELTLWISSSGGGSTTVEIIVREDTFDGPVLGSAQQTRVLTADIWANEPFVFDFGNIPVAKGSIVTFETVQVEGTGGVYFGVISSHKDATGLVIETNSLESPLGNFRDGIALSLTGRP